MRRNRRRLPTPHKRRTNDCWLSNTTTFRSAWLTTKFFWRSSRRRGWSSSTTWLTISKNESRRTRRCWFASIRLRISIEMSTLKNGSWRGSFLIGGLYGEWRYCCHQKLSSRKVEDSIELFFVSSNIRNQHNRANPLLLLVAFYSNVVIKYSPRPAAKVIMDFSRGCKSVLSLMDAEVTTSNGEDSGSGSDGYHSESETDERK